MAPHSPEAGLPEPKGLLDLGITRGRLLELLKQLPLKVQREAIVRAFARGLERQELYGSGLFRAAIGLCRELRAIGFAPVADEIEKEITRVVIAEIEKLPPETATP